MIRTTILWMILAAHLGVPATHGEASMTEGLEAVNGTELWVKRLGAGEPIVVVHGGPVLEHGYLLPHLEPLAESHELIFFDQRLSGRSAPEVDENSVRLIEFAEDIEALRKALGLERIHLMAHSWGGLIALHYALRYESNLRSLMLLDPMAASSTLWRQEQAILAERFSEADKAERQAIMATEAFAAGRPDAIEKLLRLSFKTQFNDPAGLDRLELYVPDDYSERSRQFAQLRRELESYDLHSDLASLRVPALVLFGEAEPGAALGGAALNEALAVCDLVLIEDSGHFPFIEQSEAFLSAVRRFLATLAPGTDR